MAEVSGTEASVRKGSTGEQLHFLQRERGTGDHGDQAASRLHEMGLSNKFQLAPLPCLHLWLQHLCLQAFPPKIVRFQKFRESQRVVSHPLQSKVFYFRTLEVLSSVLLDLRSVLSCAGQPEP